MKNKVILVRGISGAGKSTLVDKFRRQESTCNAIDNGLCVCSADHYFQQDGEYKFDSTKLPQAHNACFGKFLNALDRQTKIVIVDNTFIRLWEVENYVRAAITRGYLIEIWEIHLQGIEEILECARRNVHKVPLEVIERMAKNFETAKGIYTDSLVKVVPFSFNCE